MCIEKGEGKEHEHKQYCHACFTLINELHYSVYRLPLLFVFDRPQFFIIFGQILLCSKEQFAPIRTNNKGDNV